MAKIISGPEMQGSLGGLSVFTNKRGQKIIRQKGGPSKEQIKTLPSCAGMRDSISEFSNISNIAGAIRKAFGPQSEYFSDGSYFNRLMGLVRMISDTDMLHERGSRKPMDGNIYLLEGFQWNKNLHWNNASGMMCSSNIDRVTGKIEMQFESFSPVTMIEAPAGATHFQFITRGCLLGDGGNRKIAMASGEVLSLENKSIDQIKLSMQVDVKNSSEGLFLTAAGILFFEEQDGLLFAMRGKGSFAIVEVERAENTGLSEEKRQSAIQLMEQMMQQCKLVKKKGLIVFTNNEDAHAEMVRAEKKLWRKKLEKLRGG